MAANPVAEGLQRAVQRLQRTLSGNKASRGGGFDEAECCAGPTPRTDSVVLARQRFGLPAEAPRRSFLRA
jgi:hypothetical protein